MYKPERDAKRQREYRKTKKYKQYDKEYRKRIRTQVLVWRRDFYHKHQEKINSQRRSNRKKWREAVFHILGHVCVRCGEFDKRCLQFDHINGGGTNDYKTIAKSEGIYKYYATHPEEAKQKLQVLCANCNWRKKYEQNETAGKFVN